jgi:hypothetical protein
MQSTLNSGGDAPSPSTSEEIWAQLAPLLDDALNQLGETDRAALVLRYFENKTVCEIAAALRMEEEAAQKRVARALEKLRAIFVKRGVMLTATAIAETVAANSVKAAPAGLAVTVTAAAAKGTAISASITTLVKGTMKMMTWMKMKFAVSVGMVVLLAGGIATVALSGNENSREVREILKSVETQYASITSYTGTSIMIAGDSQRTNTIIIRASMKLARPDLYLSEWGTNKPTVWSDGSGDYWLGGHGPKPVLVKMWDKGMMSMDGAEVDSSFLTIAPLFFGNLWGNHSKLPTFSSSKVQKLPDEKIGDFDCYVLTSTLQYPGLTGQDTMTNTETLWIGKEDRLIHQVQGISEWPIVPEPTDDQFIVDLLRKMRSQVNPQTIAEMKKQIVESNVRREEQRKENPVYRLYYTETHENIVVNKSLPKEEFLPAIPAGLKPLENLKRFP